METIQQLAALRQAGGKILTHGLDEASLRGFADDADLQAAVRDALDQFSSLKQTMPAYLALDEHEQIARAQAGYVNFYPDDAVNPYIALAARGPWIITLKGAVIHDNGGYGMLGFGHAPQAVLEAMARPHVMANIMTPSLAQLRLNEALRKEIGRSRGACPYSHFLCLNSGSEAVSLAGRFADVNSKLMTDAGAPHAGRSIKRIAVKGAFHGRTELPAQYSDSSRKTYVQHLGSYRHPEVELLTVEPYDVAQLQQVFERAERERWHIEAMFLEPVMGEGDPGRALTPAFYQAARELTRQHGTLLLVDSIQAGLRAHGVLSIVDYPGFEGLDAPDMETYSKALNAGHYPLSVLAVGERTAALYRKGIYGNTMTTNPRALDVACTVLEMLGPELRENIRARGREFVEKLQKLAAELPGLITKVQGTGLLFSCELAPQFKCYGAGSTEEWLRLHGVGVIHGGANSLRFTPHFAIGSAEVDLIIAHVRRALLEGPRISAATGKRAAA